MNESNVVFINTTPIKVGDRQGWHCAWAKKVAAYNPDVKKM
jgi:hypothetical protein